MSNLLLILAVVNIFFMLFNLSVGAPKMALGCLGCAVFCALAGLVG